MIFRSHTILRVSRIVRNTYFFLRRHNHDHKPQMYSYAFAPGETILSHSTLGNLVDKAAMEAGDDIFFSSCDQDMQKSFLQFKNEVDRLAAGLITLGLNKGERVGLCAPNIYEWALTQFATAKAGLVLVNVNPAYQVEELKYCLKKVQCKVIIMSETYKSQNFYEMLSSIAPEFPQSKPGCLQSQSIPDLHTVILISDSPRSGTFTLNQISNAGGSNSFNALNSIQEKIQFDDPVNIQFTSGTTGNPKGATLSHHNVVNNALVSGKRLGYHMQKPIVCCQVPLYHCFGCVLGTVGSVIFQNTCIFPSPGFDANSTLHFIEKKKCTVVYGTPTMFVDILSKQENGKFDLSSLKQVVIGGAFCPASIVMNLYEKMKVKHIHIAYGSTENSPAVTVNKLDDSISKIYAGYSPPLEYVEMKVVNGEGHLLPINTEGELCTRGHILFLGYWDDKEKTNDVIDEVNWYHTGDLAEMDENGYVKIVGRKKDMVIRGGENIYPREIENFLHTHPSIQEAHVVGVPDARMGEELCAWVKIKDGHELTAQELKDFCSNKISHFKIPRYIMFVEGFPTTVSAKIQKFKMRELSVKKLGL